MNSYLNLTYEFISFVASNDHMNSYSSSMIWIHILRQMIWIHIQLYHMKAMSIPENQQIDLLD